MVEYMTSRGPVKAFYVLLKWDRESKLAHRPILLGVDPDGYDTSNKANAIARRRNATGKRFWYTVQVIYVDPR